MFTLFYSYFFFLFPASHSTRPTLEKHNSILSSGSRHFLGYTFLLFFFTRRFRLQPTAFLVRTPHHTLFDSYQPALENWLS